MHKNSAKQVMPVFKTNTNIWNQSISRSLTAISANNSGANSPGFLSWTRNWMNLMVNWYKVRNTGSQSDAHYSKFIRLSIDEYERLLQELSLLVHLYKLHGKRHSYFEDNIHAVRVYLIDNSRGFERSALLVEYLDKIKI